MINKYTNSLIHETSPYLLQHAHNPVNWYPWGEEALARAIKENKPILVSIGYSACHWCHVMERESFEDEATAAAMNRDFINIKIDREERPDLDHIYMDAVQAMTGSGGWPLNVFLTPDRKPFYGGTYFPPKPAYNRPSWLETLAGVAQAFRERRHEIDAQAENLTAHLLQSNSFGMQKLGEDEIFTQGKIDLAAENLLKTADMEWGGFGRAPKFPQTQAIQFLLRSFTKTTEIDSLSGTKPRHRGDLGGTGVEAALLSLDKMIEGGIYDQVGGGFARYATDNEWLVPHFEKMLYDNALLVAVLSEAYQLTGKERYKEVIAETIGFTQREMMNKQGGFYAALDADSEGVEGKFYVWSKKEIEQLLGEKAGIFCEYYDISEKGNLSEEAQAEQGINILRVRVPLEDFAILHKLDVKSLSVILNEGREKLLRQRETRIRPGTDDKIILGWNALMITACCKAFAATGIEDYRLQAITTANFILQNMRAEPANVPERIGLLFHTWKEQKAKVPAFLDDYAFFIQALIQLQQITTETAWLEKASELTAFVITSFSEAETGFFYYTPKGQADVIIQKKEVYDGATPSGNAVMADNLWRLGLLTVKKTWQQRAMDMAATLGNAITRYPSSFGTWACLLQEMVAGTNEIAIVGRAYKCLSEQVLKYYIPHKVLMAAEQASSDYPLLYGRDAGEKTGIYLCRNYTCAAPVFSAEQLISLINRAQKKE